jgi:ABC-type multidrug transport system fused ATPase/permease subunit
MKWTWGLLIPKGWAGIVVVSGILSGVIANIKFQDTVTIGSILTAAVVVIAGGIFSFRNNMRTFWRNLAVERQEEIKVLNQKLVESEDRYRELQEQSRDEAQHIAEEQRSIRHDLKTQLAAANKLLEQEHQKTDLTSLMEQLGQQHQDAMTRMQEGLERQARMLHLLESSVPTDAIPHDLRHDMGGQDDAAQTDRRA